MSLAGRIAREPLLHFLLLGAALFGIDRWRHPAPRPAGPVEEPVVVTPALRDELADGWTRTQGRAPTPEELDRLVAGWIDEEILYREGLARGLERGDVLVRRRVADKMGFVLEAQVVTPEPSDADLRGWYEAHRERWSTPVLIDFTQVFVKEGEGAEARAQALAARLQAGEDPAALGDVFSGGRRFRGRKLDDLGRAFGPEFTAGLEAQPEGAWVVRRSRHGRHLVRVDGRAAPRSPALEEARAVVREDWLADRRRAGVEAALARVRERWRVVRE
jgi:hypothetical protein